MLRGESPPQPEVEPRHLRPQLRDAAARARRNPLGRRAGRHRQPEADLRVPGGVAPDLAREVGAVAALFRRPDTSVGGLWACLGGGGRSAAACE